MSTCAVSVGERYWATWLDVIGNMRLVRDIEAPAALIAADSGLRERIEHYALRIPQVRDLLPAEVARYLAESPALGREDVILSLKRSLDQCHQAGARFATLQGGLDRIASATFEQDLGERVKLLRGLMPIADTRGITICVHVRYPRSYPHSKEWEYAGTLAHEVMHPCCRLAVDVVPADLPEGFDPHEFVRGCYFKAGTIRFCYQPGLGESLSDEVQAAWGAALRQHRFKGTVVFCPRLASEDAVAGACADIDRWAASYHA